MKLVGLFILATMSVFAQKSEVFNPKEGAIHGYDPVAYFKEGKPVKGDKHYVYSWKGTNWYFANQQYLEIFKADPLKFAPQYGGYCAYGMADGHKAPTEPAAWTIVDDKLYLNYNKNVQVLWQKNREEYIKTANANWPELKDKE